MCACTFVNTGVGCDRTLIWRSGPSASHGCLVLPCLHSNHINCILTVGGCRKDCEKEQYHALAEYQNGAINFYSVLDCITALACSVSKQSDFFPNTKVHESVLSTKSIFNLSLCLNHANIYIGLSYRSFVFTSSEKKKRPFKIFKMYCGHCSPMSVKIQQNRNSVVTKFFNSNVKD